MTRDCLRNDAQASDAHKDADEARALLEKKVVETRQVITAKNKELQDMMKEVCSPQKLACHCSTPPRH